MSETPRIQEGIGGIREELLPDPEQAGHSQGAARHYWPVGELSVKEKALWREPEGSGPLGRGQGTKRAEQGLRDLEF